MFTKQVIFRGFRVEAILAPLPENPEKIAKMPTLIFGTLAQSSPAQ
jgi:hypothetical protein